MNDNKEVAIKKYNAIAKANKSMFITVAIASVVVSAALVFTFFLVQKISFQAKIIGVQTKTLNAIDSSTSNIDELKKKVQSLQTNQSLLDSKSDAEDNALRVILDALPSEANTEAIGSSLSTKILNVPGLSVETMNVDPINETSVVTDSATTTTSESSAGAISSRVKTANFSFTVVAAKTEDTSRPPQKILLELLQNMEKSIRTFNITDFKVENNKNGSMTLTISGQAYYLPEYTLQLNKETIQSSETANTNSSSSTTATGGAK